MYCEVLCTSQLEHVGVQLSADGEYVDWRRFLLDAAQPWPMPSEQDLLDALAAFHDMDQKNSGYVTRQQFEWVETWFKPTVMTSENAAEDDEEPQPSPVIDRVLCLRPVLFDIFADHTVNPPVLNYVEMLLYFSVASDAYEGFLRALAVVMETHMPRIPLKKKPTSPTPGEASEVAEDVVMSSFSDANISLDALYMVMCHGRNTEGESHRFSGDSNPEEMLSKVRLTGVYEELGSVNLEPLPLSLLLSHPVIQEIVSSCTTYKAVDVKAMLCGQSSPIYDNETLLQPLP